MDFNLKERVAVVTGASGGLGYETALALAKEGCHLSISSRNQDRIEKAADEIRIQSGAKVLTHVVDMNDGSAIKNKITRTLSEYSKLDIVVANAGGPPSLGICDIEVKHLNTAFDQTFVGAFRLFQESVEALKLSDQARIVAVTSITAKQPLPEMALSNCPRAAVHALVKTLSLEYGSLGITANIVAPGMTATQRITDLVTQISKRKGISMHEAMEELAGTIPSKHKLGDPADFGAIVAFVCSKQASFLNGQTILVDGGQYTGMP